MTTDAVESSVRRWFKVRLTPSVFFLVASYLCIQAGFEETWMGRAVTNFRLATWMFFFFSWALPLVVVVVATYHFIRHRAVQHLVEIVVAVWLLIRALSFIVQA